MHLKRILSAVVFLPPLFFLVKFGTPFHFFLVLSVAIATGLHEFYTMAEAKGLKPVRALGVAGGLGLSFTSFYGDGGTIAAIPALLMMVTLLALLLIVRDLKEAVERAAVTYFGTFYIGGLLSFPILLRKLPEGEGYILSLLLITWAGDTGALYVGKLLGRRKLYPAVSPNKSVEGLLGGLASSLLASLLAHRWLLQDLGHGFFQSLGLGLFLGLLGQLGDLSESMLKRSMGAKDSGRLIPGHGGIMDVMDSVLFAGPAFYVYLRITRG